MVGNIGTAYTQEALKMTDNSVIAAEISSFQLETIENFHPKVSAIRISRPDHLNRPSYHAVLYRDQGEDRGKSDQG